MGERAFARVRLICHLDAMLLGTPMHPKKSMYVRMHISMDAFDTKLLWIWVCIVLVTFSSIRRSWSSSIFEPSRSSVVTLSFAWLLRRSAVLLAYI